ncbi:MAG: hypothetical protein KAR54_01290 [Candidatus Pacebacteria bacterium]|nr:hypothetical protein [Candidatus Paceibacterota bacterium]
MPNKTDLEMTISQLKQEIQREILKLSELKTKLQNFQTEKEQKNQGIIQKEGEIRVLKNEIEQMKKESRDNDRSIKTTMDEISKIETDQQLKNNELIKIQEELADTLRK